MEKLNNNMLCKEYYRLCQIFYDCYDKFEHFQINAETADIRWYSKGGEMSIGGYFPLNPICHLSFGNVKKGRLYKSVPSDKKYDYEYWIKSGEILKIKEDGLDTFSFSCEDEIYRISYKKRKIDGDDIVMPYYISRLGIVNKKPVSYSFGIIDGIDEKGAIEFQFEYEKFFYSSDIISDSIVYSNLQLRSFSGESFGRLIELIKGKTKLYCLKDMDSVKRYAKLIPHSIQERHLNERGKYTTTFY